MDKNAILKDTANALNRVLTKIKKEQRELILKNVAVKEKYLTKKRLKEYRARSTNLRIKITATNKQITPFMLENAVRPYNKGYGEQKNRHGGKFFISSKAKGVNGFSIGSGNLRRKDYFYIKKVTNLDVLALSFSEKLQERAVGLVNVELKRWINIWQNIMIS